MGSVAQRSFAFLGFTQGRLAGNSGSGGGASGLTRDLLFMFPVSGIYFLGEGAKPIQGLGFTDATDFVLDSVGETGVEVVPQGAITISLDLGHNPIEVYHIAVNAMGVLHAKVVELVLGVGNWAMRTKGGLEFYNKLLLVAHPVGTSIGVCKSEKVWLEPFEGHSFQVELHIGDFSMVSPKSLRPILEV